MLNFVGIFWSFTYMRGRIVFSVRKLRVFTVLYGCFYQNFVRTSFHVNCHKIPTEFNMSKIESNHLMQFVTLWKCRKFAIFITYHYFFLATSHKWYQQHHNMKLLQFSTRINGTPQIWCEDGHGKMNENGKTNSVNFDGFFITAML